MVKQEEIDIVAGVPQGGPISPTIANMVLDGLERHVKAAAAHLYGAKARAKKKTFSPKVNVVRYRDDFVITAASQRILTDLVKPRVNSFLRARGLELNQSKTLTVSIKVGLYFLGYNFRIYPYRKRQTKFIRLTKPTKAGVKRLLSKCKEVIKTSKSSGEIVFKLNPILRGWANYYSCVTSKRVFAFIGWRLWHALLKWASRKHPTLTKHRLVRLYYMKVGGRTWVYYGKYNDKNLLLYDIINTPIVRHTMVQDKNPFKREDMDYFHKRRLKGAKSFIAWDKRRLKLVKKQKYLCPVCEQLLHPQQQTDLHHILAKRIGGSDDLTNLVVLHRDCHKQVTYTNNPSLLARFKDKGILK
jgi:RNA-directed DNA polymerase